MKCPHCSTAFHDIPAGMPIGAERYGRWHFLQRECPACARQFLHLVDASPVPAAYRDDTEEMRRLALPKEVPEAYAKEYRAACLALEESPQASATISRRCLQQLLREHAGIEAGELAHEIRQILDQGHMPSLILRALEVLRKTELSADHRFGETAGESIEVEVGEADWNLDVLDVLFDYFFVHSAQGAGRSRPPAA